MGAARGAMDDRTGHPIGAAYPDILQRPSSRALRKYPVESADLLIEARWVLPIAPANTVLDDHAVAVTDGRIVALGPTSQLMARYAPRQRVVRNQHALLPGFVNAHTRAAMTLLRGLPPGSPRQQGLRASVRAAEQRCLSPDFVRAGTQLAIAEMLQAGITCFADMYGFPEEAARMAAAARMRAAIGLPVGGAGGGPPHEVTEQFAHAERLWDQYRSDPFISLYFAPRDIGAMSDESLVRLRRVTDELDARLAAVVHADVAEVTASLSKHGQRPLHRLHRLGLLRPGFAAVRMNQLDAADLATLATTGSCVILCPQADLRLGSALAPIGQLLHQHVNVGLGCGPMVAGAALDLLAEARTAALWTNAHGEELPAEEALLMATYGGAAALGLAGETGSIEPGKSADLVCIDLSALACQPAGPPAEAIVFAATRQQATDVWTSGRAAVSGGRLLAFDAQELTALAQAWAQRTATGEQA